MYNVRITTNVKQIIKNKKERAKATWRIIEGKMIVLYKGETIKPEHFELMYPIEPKTTIIYL